MPLRSRGVRGVSVSHVIAAHMVPPHSTGPLRKPMILGGGASGAGWLVASVCVRASPITIGMQMDMPHRRPPSRSQTAWASLKNSRARC
jgi:hypothetical protein